MDEEWEQQIIRDFMTPWSQRRGIASTERDAELVLVKIPLDQLSNVLESRAIESRHDVIGSEIEITGTFIFAYQLVGHLWSIIVPDRVIGSSYYPWIFQSQELVQLSKQLQQPVIKLAMSDTAGGLFYELFEDGEIAEYFSGSVDRDEDELSIHGVQPQRYQLFPYPDDPEGEEHAFFWSRHRQVMAEEIDSIWSFPGEFLAEWDAFDPALDSDYFLGEYDQRRGQRHRVQNPGFNLSLREEHVAMSVPELVRVDYFRLGI